VELEEAIRGRRTHKVYAAEPVPADTLEDLLELARWAPNHHLTEPWRFRVLGPASLVALKEAAGPEAAAKLDRAPTLVVASVKLRGGDQVEREEDLLATGCAVYAVLLGAHARGLVGYWRTPEVLRTPEGAAAVGMAEDEHFVGLIHLGGMRQEQPPPERSPLGEYVSFLP
jgi:nitroreductase